MPLMTRSSKYSDGIAAMDSQHTALFTMVNELYDAMMQSKTQTVTGPLLHKLANYTKTHFAAEEKLMASNNYPELEAHKALHRELEKKVQEFVDRFEHGAKALSLSLMNFLRDWLNDHILKVDHKYGIYLVEKGIK